MFTLTIQLETYADLQNVVAELGGIRAHVASTPSSPKVDKKPGAKEAKVPVEVADPEEKTVTYDAVKAQVLEVAKKLGREASLDLLAHFDVVSGTGDARKGNISFLKEEQYAAVIEKAREMLA